MSTANQRIVSGAELEAQLIRFINGTLLGGNGKVDRDTPLFEEGHINSLRILDLIAAVEKAIGAKIPDRAVRLANFRTVATIVRTFHPSSEQGAGPSGIGSSDVFERRRDRAGFSSPLAALVARGDVTLTSAGQVSLAGTALDVMLAVDHTVQRWARELGAAEQRYPSLIATDVLRRAGREEWTVVGEPTLSAVDGLARNDMALAPAVCYHTYPTFEHKPLTKTPTILTALGRCYRHEGGNHVPLERLWEFTMREVIVLGARDEVESMRQRLVRQVTDFVTTLDLDGTIAVAADPFFTSADEGRRVMQQAGALKHELLLTLEPNGRAIAAASFNHHLDYFGSRFSITVPNGAPAYSGCVAFGLERWVLAIFSQLGVDETGWPASAREWLDDARRTLPRA